MDYIKTSEALLDEMNSQSGEWNWLRRHIMPRTQAASEMEERPTPSSRRKHCTVAFESVHTFVGACMMYIIPAGQQWFKLKSGKKGKGKSSRYDDWFSKASEITHEELAKSNFYTVMHECLLDWALCGTGCVYSDTLPDGTLNFTYVPTGTYGGSEGRNKNLTHSRVYSNSPHIRPSSNSATTNFPSVYAMPTTTTNAAIRKNTNTFTSSSLAIHPTSATTLSTPSA